MIEAFISSIIMAVAIFYIWNNLSIEKFKWRSLRTILILFITSVVLFLIYINPNAIFRLITDTIIFIIVYKYLFKKEIKYSITGPVFSQTLCFISEALFAIVLFVILKQNASELQDNYLGTIFTNCVVSSIAIVLSKIPLVKKVCIKINNSIGKMDELTIIFLLMICVFIYNICLINIFRDLKPEILMLTSMIISLLSLILVIMFFKAKDDYYKINDKYNSSLESLKELENALTNHRIDNHENRNHLMTIRNMTTSKKIIKFIDTILDNKLKDDKNISKETDIIPAGGLRGLIYSKLLLMNSKEIEYELDVANSVRIVDILDYGNDTMLDICKIVGIFLDNAIEEVDNLEDKYIVIEMYLEEDVLTITITNTFDNTKCKDNIYKAGISTKGGNHGYGLSLVKKLVHKNKKLKTRHEINDDEFTQILKIYK